MIYNPEPYQKTLIEFMNRNERSAAFVSMGLGKTSATLQTVNDHILDGGLAALVVAPKRVARMTWPNETAKWDQFRWMKPEVLTGQKPSGRSGLYVTNYEQLQKLDSLDFCSCVIFDELTRAKNPQSKRIKAFRPLLKKHRRIGLTGTPRPNSLLELFAQIRLLDDGKRLGPSFSQFQQTYFTSDYMGYKWTPKPGAEEQVYNKISDLCITLRASDFLDLPDTVVEDIEVPLPDQARSDYETMERDLLLMLGDSEVVAVNAAVLTGKLLQLTGGQVYWEDRTVIRVHDEKIKALKRVLHTHKAEPVLVVCNFIHERERICAETGAVDASKFDGDLETAWNSGEIPVLAVDPRSMGHGLNMQRGGRIVVWFSPNWSRELYDQLNARVARKGQTLTPLVYRLIATDSIDEAVYETLRNRGKEQSAMLDVLNNLRLAHAKN